MARTHKSNYFPCYCSGKNTNRKTGRCYYRVTLRYDPTLAQDPPKCPRCGRELRIDLVRERRKDGETCYCPAAPGRDGQNRPHRKGSMKYCIHEKLPF